MLFALEGQEDACFVGSSQGGQLHRSDFHDTHPLVENASSAMVQNGAIAACVPSSGFTCAVRGWSGPTEWFV